MRLRVRRESVDAVLLTALRDGWSVQSVTESATHDHRAPGPATNGDLR